MFIKVTNRESKTEFLINVNSIQSVEATLDGKAGIGLIGYDTYVKLDQSYDDIVEQLKGLIIDNKGVK